MSQYSSRIFIKVQDTNDWKKLSELDMKKYEFYSNPFEGHKGNVFEINGDWSCYEDEMIDLIEEIAAKAPNCLVIGDTTNINVDPYNFIVYYIGDEVYSDEIEGEMFFETDIGDPFGWFTAADIPLSDEDIEYLAKFGFKE